MSLKNHTTVKWTKFGEAECDRLIKEGGAAQGHWERELFHLRTTLCFTVIF